MFRGLAQHSAPSFNKKLTYAGYQNIPASYLFCEADLAGFAYVQREVIAIIE